MRSQKNTTKAFDSRSRLVAFGRMGYPCSQIVLDLEAQLIDGLEVATFPGLRTVRLAWYARVAAGYERLSN